MRPATGTAVLVAAALLLAAIAPPAADGRLPDRMELAAVLGSSPLVQGRQARLAVEFRVADGYHVNANPPSEDWLIPTRVRIEGIEGVTAERVVYPEAIEGRFDFYSGPLRVYEGSSVAGVVLRVEADAPVGEATLTVKADYQACDDDACYAPTEASVLLPLRIAPAGTPSREIDSPLLERARFDEKAAEAEGT